MLNTLSKLNVVLIYSLQVLVLLWEAVDILSSFELNFILIDYASRNSTARLVPIFFSLSLNGRTRHTTRIFPESTSHQSPSQSRNNRKRRKINHLLPCYSSWMQRNLELKLIESAERTRSERNISDIPFTVPQSDTEKEIKSNDSLFKSQVHQINQWTHLTCFN